MQARKTSVMGLTFSRLTLVAAILECVSYSRGRNEERPQDTGWTVDDRLRKKKRGPAFQKLRSSRSSVSRTDHRRHRNNVTTHL